jgi:multicomponent K+:H+ antiporter subunit A
MLTLPILVCAIGAIAGAAFTVVPGLRKASPRALGWLLSIAPAAAFIALVSFAPQVLEGVTLTWSMPWLPAFGMQFGFYLDGLSLLFGLIVTGIGMLVTIYAGYYFGGAHGHDEGHGAEGDEHASPDSDTRFFLYLLLFMTAMLGLVMAGDIITLFLFWEGTSITSFLLIAYKTKDEAARNGAFKALFITGGGGIALLAGLLFASAIAGSTDFATILTSGEVLRNHPWYPIMLGLIAFGAFAKSAQAPLHFWLPAAMSAPTPASAYLHSATMVKAGIYLLARMHPALGGTEMWFLLLTTTGAITMVMGAIIGLRQADLKGLLAYSTISQLGILVMLIGEEYPSAYKAMAIGVAAHALYKGALFMVAGIIDHETHTRDLRKLGRIWRAMPITFVVALIAGMSFAGLPPLFGFLSKETLLAAEVDALLPALARYILAAATVLTGAFLFAQATSLVLDAFVTRPGAGFPKNADDEVQTDHHSEPLRAHEPPLGMLVGPAVLALLSIVITVVQPENIVSLLAGAASAAFGEPVKVSLELFHGINLPLVLSLIAITLGVILFALRSRIRAITVNPALTMNRAYEGVLAGIDKLAFWVTRTQAGRIRHYLFVIIVAIFTLLVLFGGLPRVIGAAFSPEYLANQLESPISLQNGLRAFSLVLAVAASLVSVLIRRDLFAILALSAAGLAMAVLIGLEPSPDVALVQVVVDILTTVVLVLALSRLPRAQREKAEEFNISKAVSNVPRDVILATGMGAIVAVMCLYAFMSRPRESVVTPFYEANSKSLTGAADIVGAIVVDFRGFDTMIEITVFSMAGAGVYTLLRHAMKKRETENLEVETADAGGAEEAIETNGTAGAPQHPMHDVLPAFIHGIGSLRTSSFVQMLAYVAMPVALVVGAVHMIYGHDQPGDGFTAGVIISLAVGLWYVVFGYEYVKERLGILRPSLLIGAGLMTVIIGSIAPVFLGGTFFSPFDFGAAMGLPLPAGFYFSTSFLFEIAICLSVLGSATFILDTLGHPERDLE